MFSYVCASVCLASGNYAPNFAHYAILNFPKKSLIMLIIILFYAGHCYYYSIVPIANNTMNKCCNVKLQVVIQHVLQFV